MSSPVIISSSSPESLRYYLRQLDSIRYSIHRNINKKNISKYTDNLNKREGVILTIEVSKGGSKAGCLALPKALPKHTKLVIADLPASTIKSTLEFYPKIQILTTNNSLYIPLLNRLAAFLEKEALALLWEKYNNNPEKLEQLYLQLACKYTQEKRLIKYSEIYCIVNSVSHESKTAYRALEMLGTKEANQLILEANSGELYMLIVGGEDRKSTFQKLFKDGYYRQLSYLEILPEINKIKDGIIDVKCYLLSLNLEAINRLQKLK
jgi:hypothetical protein